MGCFTSMVSFACHVYSFDCMSWHAPSFPFPHSVLLVAMVTTHEAVDCCALTPCTPLWVAIVTTHGAVDCYYLAPAHSVTHHRWLLWLQHMSSSCCVAMVTIHGVLWLHTYLGCYGGYRTWITTLPLHTLLWVVMVTTEAGVTTYDTVVMCVAMVTAHLCDYLSAHPTVGCYGCHTCCCELNYLCRLF